MKLTLALLTGLLLVATGTLSSQGAVTIIAQEIGGDVVFSGSGTIDLTGASFFTSTSGGASQVIPITRSYQNVTGTTNSDLYSWSTQPGTFSFGGGGTLLATSSSGDIFGMFSHLRLPVGYTTGTALSFSTTWAGNTFTGMGITPVPATYTWTIPNDTISLNIVPEPSRALLSLLGLGAVLVRRRR